RCRLGTPTSQFGCGQGAVVLAVSPSRGVELSSREHAVRGPEADEGAAPRIPPASHESGALRAQGIETDKANVLYVAGRVPARAPRGGRDQLHHPCDPADPDPVLNGELDFFFPAETSQRPTYELLGTPAADKKRLVFPG